MHREEGASERSEPRERREPAKRLARERVRGSGGRSPPDEKGHLAWLTSIAHMHAPRRGRERAERSEPRERREPAKRLARERGRGSGGRSPPDERGHLAWLTSIAHMRARRRGRERAERSEP